MAIEIVSETPRFTGPKAFTVHDSSVYIGWIKSMGEVLMHTHRSESIEGDVISGYGGLILALAEAADELSTKERDAMRAHREAAA